MTVWMDTEGYDQVVLAVRKSSDRWMWWNVDGQKGEGRTSLVLCFSRLSCVFFLYGTFAQKNKQ